MWPLVLGKDNDCQMSMLSPLWGLHYTQVKVQHILHRSVLGPMVSATRKGWMSTASPGRAAEKTQDVSCEVAKARADKSCLQTPEENRSVWEADACSVLSQNTN